MVDEEELQGEHEIASRIFGFRFSANLNRACLYSLLGISYCSESWVCLCLGLCF